MKTNKINKTELSKIVHEMREEGWKALANTRNAVTEETKLANLKREMQAMTEKLTMLSTVINNREIEN